MKFSLTLLHSIVLASPCLAWRGPLPRADTTVIVIPPPGSTPTGTLVSSGTVTPTPLPPVTISTSALPPSGSGSPGTGIGPKCGKGYTYCGYMLTSNGHNFAPADVSKAYCNGLQELCTNGKPKTDISHAVFVCMDDQPSSVQLLCACSGKCLNDAESNFIAHCDKPCIND
ncbi:hypothetical protein F5B20DRAFT_342926 [Whalleya microplaca]|nr:hypothetical protein F5B20DRAFT_342926 [Whalleya microplaca]